MLLRLQWERQVVRGQSMHMDASLDGVGVSVMGGLQDELFNLTMDRIQVPTAQPGPLVFFFSLFPVGQGRQGTPKLLQWTAKSDEIRELWLVHAARRRMCTLLQK